MLPTRNSHNDISPKTQDTLINASERIYYFNNSELLNSPLLSGTGDGLTADSPLIIENYYFPINLHHFILIDIDLYIVIRSCIFDVVDLNLENCSNIVFQENSWDQLTLFEIANSQNINFKENLFKNLQYDNYFTVYNSKSIKFQMNSLQYTSRSFSVFTTTSSEEIIFENNVIQYQGQINPFKTWNQLKAIREQPHSTRPVFALANVNNSRITNNTVSYMYDGIKLTNSTQITIDHNNFIGILYEVYIDNQPDLNEFTENHIRSFFIGDLYQIISLTAIISIIWIIAFYLFSIFKKNTGSEENSEKLVTAEAHFYFQKFQSDKRFIIYGLIAFLLLCIWLIYEYRLYPAFYFINYNETPVNNEDYSRSKIIWTILWNYLPIIMFAFIPFCLMFNKKVFFQKGENPHTFSKDGLLITTSLFIFSLIVLIQRTILIILSGLFVLTLVAILFVPHLTNFTSKPNWKAHQINDQFSHINIWALWTLSGLLFMTIIGFGITIVVFIVKLVDVGADRVNMDLDSWHMASFYFIALCEMVYMSVIFAPKGNLKNKVNNYLNLTKHIWG